MREFLKPRKIPNSKAWMRPILGARQVAALRKQTILSGGFWPYEKRRRPQPLHVKRKGHKNEHGREEREARIAEALKDQDERIAEMQAEIRANKPRNRNWFELLDLQRFDKQAAGGGKKKKK